MDPGLRGPTDFLTLPPTKLGTSLNLSKSQLAQGTHVGNLVGTCRAWISMEGLGKAYCCPSLIIHWERSIRNAYTSLRQPQEDEASVGPRPDVGPPGIREFQEGGLMTAPI